MNKSVDEKTFKDCVDKTLSGRMHPDVAAYLTGLSRPTFYKRLNQYFDPDRFGALPDDFFSGRKDFWKENTGWIKTSSAIKKYKEREKEREERRRAKEEYEKVLKHRDEFLEATKLPKLEG